MTRHTPGVAFDDDTWELYHLDEDRSECIDLAAAEPERLAAMVARWWEEAEAHGVLPLDDRTIELFAARFADGSVHRPDRHYTYRPPGLAAARPGGTRDRRAQLGPRRDHRAAERRRRRAVRGRERELRA